MRVLSLIMMLVCIPLGLMAQTVDVESAERALDDRLIRLAETQFSALLESSEDPDTLIRARLGLARTYLLSDRPQEAGKILDTLPPLDDPMWIGRANLVAIDAALMRGELQKASALLAVTPEMAGNWAVWKLRLTARVKFAEGQQQDAISFLERNIPPESPLPGLQAELADLRMKAGQRDEALALWKELAAGPVNRLETQKARLALAKVELEIGNWNTLEKQLNALLEDGGVYEELEAEAYPLFIRLFAHNETYDRAVNYVEALEKTLSNPARIADVRAYRAEFLIRAGKTEEAKALLQQLIASEGDHPLVAKAQLVLARQYESEDKLEEAAQAYESFLSVFTDPQGVVEAWIGWAEVEEKRGAWSKAEVNYGKAISLLEKESPLLPELKIKLADMSFAAKDMANAFERYDLFTQTYPAHEEVPKISFQAAVALAKADPKQLRGAIHRLREIRSRFPGTLYAEKALLQIAVLQHEGGLLEQALGSYTGYLNDYPEGIYVADALTDKGIVSYQIGFFQAALMQFDQVILEFPDHPRAEQASSLRGWALFLRGKDQEARQAAEAFLKKYPESAYAADVRLWLAMMSFNKGLFEQAEGEFLILSGMKLSLERKIQAHYLAGRSALARKGYAQALGQFNIVLSQVAESEPANTENLPYVMESLFYKGDSLTELDRFDEAIVTFDQHIAQYPDSYLKYAALGRKGDCQYTLGEKDAKRYLEALNSYQLISESSAASPEVQLQALYKQGRTLDALKRVNEALAIHQKTIEMYMFQKKALSTDADVWFVRAVTDAAQAFEQLKDYRAAVRIYSHLAQTNLPQATEARRRIQELRDTHNLLQFQGEQP